MLARRTFCSTFSVEFVRPVLETWYTRGEVNGDSRKLVADSFSIQSGREGTHMTRVPLNRAYESSIDLREKLQMSTAEIGLAVRTTNCLEERGVFTVDDLLNCRREDLLSISNFGEKTLEEVYKALEGIGFFRAGREHVGIA